MLLLALAIAAVAMLNNEIVTVHYLFGQANLTLFTLILGSALAGVILMIFFNIYRSIHNYIKAEGERTLKKELQHRVKTLEGEKSKLEDELRKFYKEREIADAKARAEVEAEKKELEEELKKHQIEGDRLEAQQENGSPKMKGFWNFLKK